MEKTSSQVSALIQHKTTNTVESHNGILVQFTKGKRVMILQGNTRLARVAFTVAQKLFGFHWVVVLYMTHFPGLSSDDFPGLPWLNRLKIQQDLKGVNKSSVLYMTRFPGLSSDDFPGLSWLNRLKIQQDLKGINKSTSLNQSHVCAHI